MKSKTSRIKIKSKRAADRAYQKQIRAACLAKGIKCRPIFLDDTEYATVRKLLQRAGIEGFSAVAKLKRLALVEAQRTPAIIGGDSPAEPGGQLCFSEVNASK